MENKFKGQGEQFVLIHAADAQSGDIKQGDIVRVLSSQHWVTGENLIKARLIVLVRRDLLGWVMRRHFQII